MTDHNPLTLYNSLTRTKEPFIPQDPKRVTMYNCGPTVYSYAHIGNARAAVVADVLFRVLRHIYGEEHVVYARNITDVDDKIIATAIEQGVSMSEITEKYARIYNEDLAALNCLPPTVQPKATDHIQEMADIIVTLLERGIAYVTPEGHVLFDVTKMDKYGKLSGRKFDEEQLQSRIAVEGYKKNSGDFLLWKIKSNEGDIGWSPSNLESYLSENWNKYSNQEIEVTPGRPGWHIECSAMVKATLGETIDVHCGGIDLKFPHHENEIAQSECANEKEFSKFWVHNEFLNMGSEKMSKSLGNVTLVHDLLKEWDGEVIRLALLKAHYRSELNWSEDLLRESKAQLDSWYGTLRDVGSKVEIVGHEPYSDAVEKLLSDLNTPNFLGETGYRFGNARMDVGALLSLESRPHHPSSDNLIHATRNQVQAALSQALAAANLLGLLQQDPEDWFKGNASSDDQSKFDAIASRRQEARAAKDWAAADAARDEATALGIVLEDGPDGTSWRKA